MRRFHAGALVVSLLTAAGIVVGYVYGQGITVPTVPSTATVLRLYPVTGGMEARDALGAPIFRIENGQFRIVGKLQVDGVYAFKTPLPTIGSTGTGPCTADGGRLVCPDVTISNLLVTGEARFDGPTLGVKYGP
jgi:hypothetical protein